MHPASLQPAAPRGAPIRIDETQSESQPAKVMKGHLNCVVRDYLNAWRTAAAAHMEIDCVS